MIDLKVMSGFALEEKLPGCVFRNRTAKMLFMGFDSIYHPDFFSCLSGCFGDGESRSFFIFLHYGPSVKCVEYQLFSGLDGQKFRMYLDGQDRYLSNLVRFSDAICMGDVSGNILLWASFRAKVVILSFLSDLGPSVYRSFGPDAFLGMHEVVKIACDRSKESLDEVRWSHDFFRNYLGNYFEF